MIDIKWGRGTGGREKGMGVGERGHLPFPFLAFFPLSLPFPLRLAQASIFCKIFSRVNRRAKVWVTDWYYWFRSVRLLSDTSFVCDLETGIILKKLILIYSIYTNSYLAARLRGQKKCIIQKWLKVPALRSHEFEQALSLYFRVPAKTSDRTSVEQTEGTHHDGGIYETFLS